MITELGTPMMSGFCAHPSTDGSSHGRCQRQGGGNRANPAKLFSPCPCSCHLSEERYECECGGELAVALNLSGDTEDEMIYVHVDPRTGRSVGAYCP